MIQCARCAAANQPTSKYCLSCGSPLPAASGGPAATGQPGAAPQPPPAWNAQPSPPPPLSPFPNPPPVYGSPPQRSEPEHQQRFGSPEGLNPYGATVGPQMGQPGGGG